RPGCHDHMLASELLHLPGEETAEKAGAAVQVAALYNGSLIGRLPAMLHRDGAPPADPLILLGQTERALYESLVPQDHFLRRLLQAIDFESFRPLLTTAYCPDQGR